MNVKLKVFLPAIASIFCFALETSALSEKVYFPEPSLELEVSRTLGVSPEEITKTLLEDKLKILNVNDSKIKDLRGLEFASNLEILVLRNNLINDLSPIRGLKKLQKLDLAGNRLTDLKSLGAKTIASTDELSLTGLTHLNLSGNKLRGLAGVENFLDYKVLMYQAILSSICMELVSYPSSLVLMKR